MKTLIIPDIHTKHSIAESIITYEKPDKTIFLGDYFDEFGETHEMVNNAAIRLKNSLQKNDRIHLIGNHDLNYMSENRNLKCSGFEYSKFNIIKSHNLQWYKMKLFCWVNDWLCTHAGFSNILYNMISNDLSVNDTLNLSVDDLQNIDDESFQFKFINAGISRGGSESTGGIIWCDYDEFIDIPGIKQIFGHTRDQKVRRVKNKDSSEHICLDTVLKDYAVYEDETMIVKSVQDIPNIQ